MLQKLIILFLAFAIFSGPRGSSADQPSCSDLGFGSFVLCSDCVHLASFVQDQTLTDECNRCCTPNSAEKEEETFSDGILETCPLMMRYVVVLSPISIRFVKDLLLIDLHRAEGSRTFKNLSRRKLRNLVQL